MSHVPPPPASPQVKVIRQEGYSYRDPVTEFIECLYVNFDFDGAQSKLAECDKVMYRGWTVLLGRTAGTVCVCVHVCVCVCVCACVCACGESVYTTFCIQCVCMC